MFEIQIQMRRFIGKGYLILCTSLTHFKAENGLKKVFGGKKSLVLRRKVMIRKSIPKYGKMLYNNDLYHRYLLFTIFTLDMYLNIICGRKMLANKR